MLVQHRLKPTSECEYTKVASVTCTSFEKPLTYCTFMGLGCHGTDSVTSPKITTFEDQILSVKNIQPQPEKLELRFL